MVLLILLVELDYFLGLMNWNKYELFIYVSRWCQVEILL